MQTTRSLSRLSIRLPLELKERIEQAAVISGVSLTDFTISNLSESADEILERQQYRRLSDRDRELFLAMLDSTTEPSEELADAFRARRELISE